MEEGKTRGVGWAEEVLKYKPQMGKVALMGSGRYLKMRELEWEGDQSSALEKRIRKLCTRCFTVERALKY